MAQKNTPVAVLLAGMGVGAGLVWWVGASTRREVREMLVDYTRYLKDELLERGQQALRAAINEGLEYLERGGADLRETARRT